MTRLMALVGAGLAQLTVIEPPELAQNLTSIAYSMSSFGNALPFGRTLLTAVYAPEPGNESGCVAMKAFDERFVYLMLRGKCTYSKKAFLAQLAGAAAVLVYHDDPAANLTGVVPVSDAIYNNIQIPVLLIGNADGLAITEALRQGSAVRLSVTPQVGGRQGATADVEFWFDLASLQAIDFILGFERVVAGFEGRLTFRPKYKLESLAAPGPGAPCFGHGAYCVAEKYRPVAESMLREVVRQVCLLNLSGEGDPGLKSWFEYLRPYRKCLGDALGREDKSLDCFEGIRQSGEVDGGLLDRVESCYAGSFANATDSRSSANSVLADHQRSVLVTPYSLLPAVFVNHVLVKEDVELPVVVSAVCSDVSNPPIFCSDFFTQNIDWGNKQKKVFGAGKFIGLVLLGVSAASVVCIYCCVRVVARRKINNEISQFVREHVNEYILENSLKAAGVMNVEDKRFRAV